MACIVMPLPGGGAAIVCGRFPRPKQCSVCRTHVGDKLCDGKVAGQRGTCSAPICGCCATTRPHGKDTLDFCPRHREQAGPEQLGLGDRRG